MENKIELEIPRLLPGVESGEDECLNRLEKVLQDQKGIIRAHLEREKSPVDLCLHYDPDSLNQSEVEHIAERSGKNILKRYCHESIHIAGMDCSDCVTVLEHSLSRIDGVLDVRVNYASEKIWIEFDCHRVNRHTIEKRIRSLGYSIPLNEFQEEMQENRELAFSILCGILVLAGWLGNTFFSLPSMVGTGLYLVAYLFGGWDIARHAWHALRERHFDTDLLMVMAAIGAAVLGDFAEGALLLFLFSLGHAMEERALDRARKAVNALTDLAPKTARVRRDDVEIEIPVETIQLGEVVIARAGARIPVDGRVIKGTSGVDQAPVTGESNPVDKTPGDMVFTGTINGEGALEIIVTRLAKDSTLSRIMKMVEDAQSQKSPTQLTLEKFERVFVPIVLAVTALVIIVPPMFGFPFHESFLRAMTLLVAASPCALALGTPAAILAGVAQAARNGVLVKGGAHLENLGLINAIAFDKTGTVTYGKPEVTDIIACGMSRKELLSLVAGAETRSGHPLSRAIVRKAQSLQIPLSDVDSVESLTGVGLRASAGGKKILIGNQTLAAKAVAVIPAGVLEKSEEFQSAGKTLIWVTVDGQIAGLIALADTIRPEAVAVLKQLHQLGISHTVMLTGDNAQAASTIASEAGLTEFRTDLMPEDKLGVISELTQQYQRVAMIGDGVNDAPALANATVGIAMGGAGTDVALETADVALMGDDLSRLPFAIGLGRATRVIIIQNLAIALGVIGLLIISSVTGLVGIGVAVVLHEGSTIVVVLNSLRLLRYS